MSENTMTPHVDTLPADTVTLPRNIAQQILAYIEDNRPGLRMIDITLRDALNAALAKIIRSTSTYDCTPRSVPPTLARLPFAPKMYYGGEPEVSPFAAIPYFPGSKDYMPFAYLPPVGTPSDGIAPPIYLTPSPDTATPTDVPEPSILSLYVMGFGMLCCASRRKS